MDVYTVPVLNLDTGEIRDISVEADCWQSAQVEALRAAFVTLQWRRTTWLSGVVAGALRRGGAEMASVPMRTAPQPA